MEIRFEAAGAAREEELQSLYGWLTDDRALRGGVRVTRVTEDEDEDDAGRMGPGLDAVLAVLSAVSGVGQLHLSYLAWRRSHRPRGRVSVEITGDDPDQVAELLRRFAEADGAGGAGADGADGEQR
ncbi:hypothetical protein ABZ357_09275 [Streptomyces sp. NPDC005917]|uniref:effector-associated constant component EACC1 n=1 Tax=unclassified Streptomyces TaxID=2593676 RepID=UPI0033F0715A